MSYRALKRLLGETNFELKSLVLFGLGLTALSTVTVILYWRLTSNLIDTTIRREARLLAADKLLERHWQRTEHVEEFVPMIEKMARQMRPDDLQGYESEFLSPNPTGSEGDLRPGDQFGYSALEELRQGAEESIHIDREEGKYHYFSPMVASESCITCHYHEIGSVVDGKLVRPKPGDLLGVVKITLPLERNEEALHYANAFVITLEFVKVVLAILAIYLVVRYVITKPVLHLKKVSDAIARGNLDMRADIRTGDEFEELSHAFNRMLRHLVTVQEELRDVNADLDGKVDELAQVNLRLYELNKVKDEFLATMSHELRTPLNSILGFGEVLEAAENLDERQKRYLTNIQKSGRELMVLINDVLDLAKIESGKMEMHAVDFEPAEIISRQVEAMAAVAEQKNIRLTCELDSGLDSIHQDSGKLQQIINNLLSNAIKFTPEGGRVRVATRAIENDRFELIVEDTGIGIPLEDQATVFEKFRQGKSIPGQSDALTREYEGTGLGLSIVRELSTLLGGEVLLESEFGKGSTFRVRLPRRLDETTRRRDPLLEAQSLAQSPAFAPRRIAAAPKEDSDSEEEAVPSQTADDPAEV